MSPEDGIAAPQCDIEDTGIAAPQCGIEDDNNNSRTGVRRSQLGWYSRGYIPHLDCPNTIQHITYRLADSLPQSALERMQEEVTTRYSDDIKRQNELRQRIETFLDSGYGSCVLRRSEIAEIIIDTWFRFDGERYRLLEWVVMPNHCHVLIEPFEGCPLGKIVLSWKNYTARFINGIAAPQCGTSGAGITTLGCGLSLPPPNAALRCSDPSDTNSRSGERRSQVWQREYWDRYIRDQHHYDVVTNYIAMNPVNAGLVSKPEDWLWGSVSYRKVKDGIQR